MLTGTWSKMAIGIARVAQALGTSTMPDRRPSHGQQDSSRYTCEHKLCFLSQEGEHCGWKQA